MGIQKQKNTEHKAGNKAFLIILVNLFIAVWLLINVSG